jgi:hypothetical protein
MADIETSELLEAPVPTDPTEVTMKVYVVAAIKLNRSMMQCY